jgi:uncharacterized membrane protein
MKRFTIISGNLTFALLILLLFLLVFEQRMVLPVWLQVVGRMHPLIVHLPVGLIIFSIIILLLRKQFKKNSRQQLIILLLVLISLTSSLAALFGLFLSSGGDYGEDALFMHKAGGVILSMVNYSCTLLVLNQKINRMLLRSMFGIIFLLVIFTGHTGSVLTHGENYLFGPLFQSTNQSPDPAMASVYELSIQPVLEKKCYSCHNASKAKGLLVMTDLEQFKRGGQQGKEWVEGQPELSRIIQYIHLPLEDDKHMPPDGKAQLSPFEMELLEAWVRSGADFDRKLQDYAPTDTLVVLTNQVLQAKQQSRQISHYAFKASEPELIEQLNNPVRTVTPLFQNSPALQAEFFIHELFTIQALEELKPVRDQLVILNLSKMPVHDDDLKRVGDFKNLEKLNLNFTSIQGEGLKHLSSLEKLQSLSLSGTRVTSDQLEAVLTLPSLKEIFLWKTPISENDLKSLVIKYPDIKFIHSLFPESETMALSRPQLVNEEVIRKGEKLQLRHAMPGVSIRYTLDGSPPDSLTGTNYNQSVEVINTVQLKAIACKGGWFCSDVLSAMVFVEGIKPVNVELLTPPDKQYPGKGAGSLIDLQKGFADNFKDPSWLGYRDHAFEAGFDFGANPPRMKQIVISYGDNLGSYIFPPARVEVWGGDSKENLNLLKRITSGTPANYRPNSVEALIIDMEDVGNSYYKIVAYPIQKLPEWHGGKGQKGWFFVDEIFFYATE